MSVIKYALCGCGCGERFAASTKGREKRYLNEAHRKEAQKQRDSASTITEPVPVDQTRPAPKFCGLCPFQGQHGVHPCVHTMLASRWMTYHAASEARIHGACPWGRLAIIHPTTEGEK